MKELTVKFYLCYYDHETNYATYILILICTVVRLCAVFMCD